jgi:tRNA uridine 5-carboxymethylaminomethyl modification enzyme
MPDSYDILIIGGGHAGAEAAWAASRLGCRTALITMDPLRIGQMSCNPAIGGLAKGQMVREIDALGGLMGIATDNTGIQFRMLNRSKGPAVWGPRAQADKHKYAVEVQRLLSTCPNLTIIPGEVAEITTDSVGWTYPPTDATDGGRVHPPYITGVTLKDGTSLSCRSVIVTTGTFLRGLMHTGERQTAGGRVGEPAATGLTACLAKLGLEMGRLKTGTPPRLDKPTIDFAAFVPQPGDERPAPFSYLNENVAWNPPLPQVHCWIGATNEKMHEIIRANLHRAPMYSGQIASTGPRYCPSIEDKVVRFADKSSHHIFLEPEGLDTDEIYCNGISTSLPADVQETIVRLIPGLENTRIIRYGYAVEYDMVWPTQIQTTLQTKRVGGLFLAGQINGTSGYEEAAAQGLIAGINAALLVKTGRADFVLRRDQAYIGVLIDDLVTKPPTEPYRMFTSRAEHRLRLRNDNADERLTPLGREIGLVDDHRWQIYTARRDAIENSLALLRDGGAADYLRRSEVNWPDLCQRFPALSGIASDVAASVESRIKYEGYISRQDKEIQRMSAMETKLIPTTLDYATVSGLRNEAKQKLTRFSPRSLGQALRISGITPADVTVLAIHLDRK